GRIAVNAELESLPRLAPVFKSIQIDQPVLRIAHAGGGRYDFDDVLRRLASQRDPDDAADADDGPVHFALYNIELKNGTIHFDDQPAARVHTVRQINLSVPFLSNLPSRTAIQVLPQLSFVANGSAFDSRAQALPFDASRQAEAVFRVARFDLAPYLDYWPASLPLRLKAATVDAEITLKFEQTPQPALRVTGAASVSGLQASDTSGARALAFERLAVKMVDARPLERRVHLSEVTLAGAQAALRRDAQGRLNWLTVPPAVAQPPRPEAAAASAASVVASATPAPTAVAARPSWQVRIDRVALQDGGVDWQDETTAPAAAVHLRALNIHAERVAYPLDEALRFRGAAALALGAATRSEKPESVAFGNGAAPAPQPAASDAAPPRTAVAAPASAPALAAGPGLTFEGEASVRAASVTAQLADIPLALAKPYLAAHLRPELDGRLDAQIGLQWAAGTADAQPQLQMTAGQLTLSQLTLTQRDGGNGNASGALSRPGGVTAKNTPTAAARQSSAARSGAGLPRGQLAAFGQIAVTDAQIDWHQQRAHIGKLALQAPRIDIERDRNGRWMAQNWLTRTAQDAPATTTSAKPGAAASGRWSLDVDEASIADGAVGWRDAQTIASAAAAPVNLRLAQIDVTARQLQWPALRNATLDVSATVAAGRAEPGRLQWRAQVALDPALTVQGHLNAQRLPVHALGPYFGDVLNIDVLRADASFNGQLQFSASSGTGKGPRLALEGDLRVDELRANSRPGTAAASVQDAGSASAAAAAQPVVAAAAAGTGSQALVAPSDAAALGEELLSCKRLALTGLRVNLTPGKAPRISVKGTQLTDFYARVIVHANGRVNLQDFVKSAPDDAARAGEGAASQSPAAAGAPQSGSGGGDAPVIDLGPTRLVNGKVYFSDRFIQPNYSADLSELNGTLGAFGSAPLGAGAPPQMAELNLQGRAEGTARLEITGHINPLVTPLALDIHGKVTDLELPPLSPYAIKYAGHGIERGKFSTDVRYRVQPDGLLTASNKLVLNQLEFGEAVPGAPASLPVKLATALLADGNGVIDVDLPISGSLNDPQFSLGPVIVKAIFNLIAKAVTAPFSLLAGALGAADGQDGDASHVVFEAGSADLTPAARAQLDAVARALLARPRLKLTVTGMAQLEPERQGYKRQRLMALLAAEQRGQSAAAAEPLPEAPTPASSAAATVAQDAATIAPSDYPRLLRRLYRRADVPGKPRNMIGLAKDISEAEMEAILMAHIEVTDDAMRQLAVRRGVVVKDHLAARGVPVERLFLGAARIDPASASSEPAAPAASAPETAEAVAPPWLPRAELSLAAR
ncbi:MAG: DUF748 domain-containing protein, partial [Burkholderiaceae bacterium]|nr:DUF748 domain-containing protein [Burkholderiaceae bacterium]